MKMWQWVFSTAVAGITAGATIVTLWGSLVYSSTQGKALEVQVETLEQRQREDIAHIRYRIDEIYKILIRKRND